MSLQNEKWVQKMRDSKDHREFVGPTDEYDLNAAMQFNLLTFLGLREYHTLLDIGCGSLRGGRLFIVYLLPHHYFAIEPEQWLVEKAISNEMGRELIDLKSPCFTHNSRFLCDVFGQQFDYVLAQGVFVHAPECDIRKCISETAKCMKSTSIFAATYMQGHENHMGGEWLYPGTTTYTPTRISEMASAAGLTCLPIHWPHPRGAQWILLCNPKNKDNILNFIDKASKLHLRENLNELQRQLSESEQKRLQLSKHPYVRIGIKMNRILRRLLRFH